ncbi:hypothetical protein D3C84_1013630 [compost metagenome]
MQHRGNAMLAKQPVEQFGVADVALDKQRRLAADALYPAQRLRRAIAQVVQHHHLEAGFEQGQGGVRTDIAGTAGYQDFVSHRGGIHSKA